MAQTPCSLGKTSAIVIILPFVSCLPRGIGLDYSRTPSLLPILLCFLLYIFSCRSSSLIFPINSCGVLLFLVPQSCPTLCNLMNCSPPGSSVHGIFQVRILEWVAISFSRGSSQARDQTSISCVSCIAGRFFPPQQL